MPSSSHNPFMAEAIRLATCAHNATYPNPRVGAVLVHKDEIIGSGYHHSYGQAHAEVECLASVSRADQWKIKESRLYLTLEPCSHHGKTPPCVDRILEAEVPEVIIAVPDPNPLAAGGAEKLRSHGVRLTLGLMAEEARQANLYFLESQRCGRPYIILKWAEDYQGNMAAPGKTVRISGEAASHLNQIWRSEIQSILIGRKTAEVDDPALTNRSGMGIQPTRIVLDPKLVLDMKKLQLGHTPPDTWILNTQMENRQSNPRYLRIPQHRAEIEAICQVLAQADIINVLVEGGPHTLEQFIASGLYDEIRILRSTEKTEASIAAPRPDTSEMLRHEEKLGTDNYIRYTRQNRDDGRI